MRTPRLAGMVVAVNQVPQYVRDGSELPVFFGDQVAVLSVILVDDRTAVQRLTIKGLPRHDGPNLRHTFSTADLRVRDSVDKLGKVFAISAGSRGTVYGSVRLRLVDPELKWLEVTVNGAARILREGEPITLRATDLFKVERVRTSLSDVAATQPENDGGAVATTGEPPHPTTFNPLRDGGAGGAEVRFAIGPADDAALAPMEIRLSRAGKVFARIPLTVRE